MQFHRPRAVTRPVRVGVVVPCYNYGRFLSECVRSIRAQPGVQTRVLVVDDCSQDDTQAVAEGLAAADPAVSYLRNETNRGHIATFNRGLSLVDADLVVLISADDLLAPGALARAAAVMQNLPRVGLVYGLPQDFEGAAPQAAAAGQGWGWSVWPGHEWLSGRCRRGRNPIFSPEVVLRRSVADRIGGYAPELPHTSDLHMWLRAADVADVARVNGPVQAYRRIHDTNMSRGAFGQVSVDLRQRLRAFEAFLDARPDDGRTAPWRRAVHRAVAAEAAFHLRAAFVAGRSVPDDEVDALLALLGETLPPSAAGRVTARLDALRPDAGRPARLGRLVGSMRVGARERVVWHGWRWAGL